MSNREKNTNFKRNPKSFWVYGKHSVISVLKNEKRKIFQLVLTSHKSLEELKDFIKPKVKVRIEKPHYIDSLLPNSVIHQNYAAEIENLEQPIIEDIIDLNYNCLLLLDQITDSHNVGAILRSAAAFSFGAVISTTDNSPEENATLIKSASGAFEKIPYIKIVNLSNCIKFLKSKNYWCIGLDVNSDHYIENTSLPQKVAFIMGSEDKGLRKLTQQNCDMLIKLRISDQVESLNVSNAAAIISYEYRRQFSF